VADITWPTTEGVDFDPQAFDEALEFNVEITVARSGKVSTQSLPGARFRCVMQFRDETMSRLVQRRRLFAFFASLRGGADRLLLWNLLTPEPLGKMRGTVTLAALVAAGASTAQLAGGLAKPNLLANSGFEIDSNADGLANGWTVHSAGVTGAITYITPDGNGSALSQLISSAGHGPAEGDQAGKRASDRWHSIQPVSGHARQRRHDQADCGVVHRRQRSYLGHHANLRHRWRHMDAPQRQRHRPGYRRLLLPVHLAVDRDWRPNRGFLAHRQRAV